MHWAIKHPVSVGIAILILLLVRNMGYSADKPGIAFTVYYLAGCIALGFFQAVSIAVSLFYRKFSQNILFLIFAYTGMLMLHIFFIEGAKEFYAFASVNAVLGVAMVVMSVVFTGRGERVLQ